MSISVCGVLRKTGETVYTVRDDNSHRLVARVTSDGFFYAEPDRFYGWIQDPANQVIEPSSETGLAALAAVADYEAWNRQVRGEVS